MRHAKEYALSSESTRQAIFVSQEAQTTAWEAFTSMPHTLDQLKNRETFTLVGENKFSDEGGKGKDGNLIYYIEPDDAAYGQADWFCPNVAEGLTQAGLARINQSIEGVRLLCFGFTGEC